MSENRQSISLFLVISQIDLNTLLTYHLCYLYFIILLRFIQWEIRCAAMILV